MTNATTATCNVCEGIEGGWQAERFSTWQGGVAHNRCIARAIAAAKTADAATLPALTVTVVNFKIGPREARRLGGSYDGASKTWAIPAGTIAAADLGRCGLALARTAARRTGGCPSYTRDQGCPLHGETCTR